jgi:hypothetical protein
VSATAILYAPLAVTYMWFAFDVDAPHLQEAVASAVDGRNYVLGADSVRAVRATDYLDHRVAMVIHTTLGALALVLAICQYSRTVRRRPRVHRWIGRLYLILMSSSMLTAMVFLMRTSAVSYPGQSAFRLQLWVLAVSTLGSGWIAFATILRGDVRAHRAWLALNTSFMMTAPLLRVLWIALGAIVPEHHLLTNLGVSAVVLAVAAPASGAIAVMLAEPASPEQRRPVGTVTPYGLLAALSIAGAELLTRRYAALAVEAAASTAYVWFHTIPALAYAAGCALGAVRARTAGDINRERQWRVLMTGAALAPWSALAVGLIASVPLGSSEGYVAGLMVGPGSPIVVTFALLVFRSGQSSRPWRQVPTRLMRMDNVRSGTLPSHR